MKILRDQTSFARVSFKRQEPANNQSLSTHAVKIVHEEQQFYIDGTKYRITLRPVEDAPVGRVLFRPVVLVEHRFPMPGFEMTACPEPDSILNILKKNVNFRLALEIALMGCRVINPVPPPDSTLIKTPGQLAPAAPTYDPFKDATPVPTSELAERRAHLPMSWRGASLKDLNLSYAGNTFAEKDFTGARDCEGLSLVASNLEGSNWSGVNLTGACLCNRVYPLKWDNIRSMILYGARLTLDQVYDINEAWKGHPSWTRTAGVDAPILDGVLVQSGNGIITRVIDTNDRAGNWNSNRSVLLDDADFRGLKFLDDDTRDAFAKMCGSSAVGADFSHAQLAGINLKTVNLTDANFCDADLSAAELQFAILCSARANSGTNLTRTNLEGARMDDFVGKGVCFGVACVRNVCFDRAQLQGSDWEGAQRRSGRTRPKNVHGCSFDGTNLQGAKNFHCIAFADGDDNIMSNVTVDESVAEASSLHGGASQGWCRSSAATKQRY